MCHFTSARSENSLQIVGECISVGHSSKSLCSSYIVLVEDLSKGSTVGVDTLEVLCSLCVVATGDLEITKHLVVVASSERLAQESFSTIHIALTKCEESSICVSFRKTSSLVKCILCIGEVAFGISQLSKTVVSTLILVG